MPKDAKNKTRLADALRANLRRRKVQARAAEDVRQKEAPAPSSTKDEPQP